jgi:two-component system sensor histidine kinase YesM
MVKNQGPKVFSIVKQLRSTHNTERILGAIKVDANYKGIEVICSKVNMGPGGGLFIMDEKRNMIYISTQHLHAEKFFDIIRKSGKNTVAIEDNDTPYLLNATVLPRSNWTILAVSSVTELNRKATETKHFGIWIALACSALAFIVLYWFIGKFLTPFLTIIKLMKEVEKDNLSVRFPDRRSDEIGYLGASFNGLVSKISEMLEENTKLVKQVYETQLLQKEAQVQALYNQIRPHFIFNTLNMISLQMQTGKQDKAIDHIHKLSSMLRSMTMWDKDITLQREIELLQAYLSIQSSRYEGRLDYTIQVDPALYSIPIPALLFQPIVENAVIHGCEAQREKTTIRVYSETGDNEITFIIQDTGKGMDQETLALLRRKLEHLELDDGVSGNQVRNGLGIGLINVNKRMKLKYGPEYGITVDSTLNEGTTIKIILPRDGFERSSTDV